MLSPQRDKEEGRRDQEEVSPSKGEGEKKSLTATKKSKKEWLKIRLNFIN